MKWVSVNELPVLGKKVIIYSPCIDEYRIVDSQFVRICKDATHWAYLEEPPDKAGKLKPQDDWKKIVSELFKDDGACKLLRSAIQYNSDMYSKTCRQYLKMLSDLIYQKTGITFEELC